MVKKKHLTLVPDAVAPSPGTPSYVTPDTDFDDETIETGPTENEDTLLDSILNVEEHDLINPNDFESVQMQIRFFNFTSSTLIENGQWTMGKEVVSQDSPATVAFQELDDETLTLEVPSRSCTMGHTIDLVIKLLNLPGGKNLTIELFKLTVTDTTQVDRERQVITLKGPEKEFQRLEPLRDFYQERQKQIEVFMRLAKGTV